MTSITDDVVILPKLFRILSTGHFSTGLDLIVEVPNGQSIRMTHPVEDLVFDEG
ncbi:hypothetical protein [Streptomyces sp. NPDC001678]|uniref:hypothetical protein n=1 Tax=Streptomyces sp. NPDC001678 TaxID=3364599 RepID=UPI0036897748